MNFLEESNEIKNWLIKCRRRFHQIPEIGMSEYKTANLIRKELDKDSIPYKMIGETGILATIKGDAPGKTVAIRADIDGLPIKEKNDIIYKSKHEGKMHACGHDAHITIALGVAKILIKNLDKLQGTVKVIFQPAEETIGGAKELIKAGVLKNPDVDYIFGLHVAPEIPVGKIGIKYGQMHAASDTFEVRIEGRSTHAAYPHTGVDSIVIAGQLISAIQLIVSRNTDPLESAVVTLGTIHGGMENNIIAGEVEMTGTIRTLSPRVRIETMEKFAALVDSIPKNFGAHGYLEHIPSYGALINDKQAVDCIKKSGEEILGKNNVKIMEKPRLDVEDFSYYLKEIPGGFFRLGCRNEEKGIFHQLHDSSFNIDEDCLPIGVAIQLKNIMSVLNFDI